MGTGTGAAGAGPGAPALHAAILQCEEGRPARAGAARACGLVAFKDAVRRGRPAHPLRLPSSLPVVLQLGGALGAKEARGV